MIASPVPAIRHTPLTIPIITGGSMKWRNQKRNTYITSRTLAQKRKFSKYLEDFFDDLLARIIGFAKN